jgi:hypothetical protein
MPYRKEEQVGWEQTTMYVAVLGIVRKGTNAFTACDCFNRSNVVELYSLLEPDACATSDRNREMETVVYGKIVQMK